MTEEEKLDILALHGYFRHEEVRQRKLPGRNKKKWDHLGTMSKMLRRGKEPVGSLPKEKSATKAWHRNPVGSGPAEMVPSRQ